MRERSPSTVSNGWLRSSNCALGTRMSWSPMQTSSLSDSRLAISSHVRDLLLTRMPPTNSTSSSNANTECPITPLRRTSGREWGLLKCSSVESASHGGRSWFRIRAAVTCEIQAPGDATESARAAASSSKLQAVGRYSSRLTWATSALRSLLGGTPDAFADSKVKGADTRLSGRSVRGCMRHCCSKRTGPAEVIHRRANRPTALEEASVLTRRKVRKRLGSSDER